MIKVVFSTLVVATLIGCGGASDDNSNTQLENRKPIHSLTMGEVESLLQDCYGIVAAQQDMYADKLRGKTELVTRSTDQSYKMKLPSKSYLSLEQRLKHFERYKTLNLNFAFWGSEQTPQGYLSRYVVVWHCSTNGHKITSSRRGPKVKLAH